MHGEDQATRGALLSAAIRDKIESQDESAIAFHNPPNAQKAAVDMAHAAERQAAYHFARSRDECDRCATLCDRRKGAPRDRTPISKISSLQQHRQMGVLMRGCNSRRRISEFGADAPRPRQ